MRIFIAIELPEEEEDGLRQVQNELAKICQRGRFYERRNLHLTLRFLGEAAEAWLPELRSALTRTASGQEPFTLRFGAGGTFGEREPWSVVWLGVSSEQASLETLQRRLEENLALAGFPLEERPYRPHITLARQAVLSKEQVRTLSGKAVPPLRVTSLALMESVVEEGRRVYLTRERFFFRAGIKE
jgi:RNA 2',3'-cyclic 3'-phosphodiesterase